jgi:GNAT superfamily N-acetyltransferase
MTGAQGRKPGLHGPNVMAPAQVKAAIPPVPGRSGHGPRGRTRTRPTYRQLGSAEVAYMVDPDWQGAGLRALLHARMLEYARGRGVRGFRADVLVGNTRMMRVFERAGHRLSVRETAGDRGSDDAIYLTGGQPSNRYQPTAGQRASQRLTDRHRVHHPSRHETEHRQRRHHLPRPADRDRHRHHRAHLAGMTVAENGRPYPPDFRPVLQRPQVLRTGRHAI